MTSRVRLEPGEALRVVMHALRGRIAIPLSLVRARLDGLTDKVALELEDASPGLRVRGEAHALGAPIRFGARLDADGVHVLDGMRTVRLHVSSVSLATDADAPGPLADAIRNGMIDTDNPATLIGNMISLPEMIVEAEGRDIVIDLMKAPPFDRDPLLREALAAGTSYLCVTGIRFANDALELELGFLPGGAKEAAVSTARAALLPVVRYLWPEGRP